jgi:hypothetical protein
MAATTTMSMHRLCADSEVWSALAVLARWTESSNAVLDVAACATLICHSDGIMKGGKRWNDPINNIVH